MSVLDTVVNETQLMCAFGLEDVSVLLRQAEESGYLNKEQEGWTFHMPQEKILRQSLALSMFLRPVYSLWDGKTVGRSEIEHCRSRLQEMLSFSYEDCVTFFNRVGAFAEKRKNFTLATSIYQETVAYAGEAVPSARKALFVRSVRSISRIMFMCGLSSIQTLNCQHEALRMIHQPISLRKMPFSCSIGNE